MKKLTLQQQADKEGVSRQAIWLRTEKGKAYRKAYRKRIQDDIVDGMVALLKDLNSLSKTKK